MMQMKIRILAITPYQSLKNSIELFAASNNDIEVFACTGNLEDGAQLARQYMNDGYDVILSRGGTADLIKSFSAIPVIDIAISAYDILRAVQLAEASGGAFAAIGFPSITTPLRQLCGLIHYDIDIITIQDEFQAAEALRSLKARGFHFILCDVITETLAKQEGLAPILIISGTESIEEAFRQAAQICSGAENLKRYNFMLEDALKNQPADTVIMDGNGSLLFSTYHDKNVYAMTAYLKKLVCENQKASLSKGFHFIDGALYSLSLRRVSGSISDYFLFCIEPNPIPSSGSKYGIRFAALEDTKDMYANSFYALTSSAAALDERIRQLNASPAPVMILGERGSGKNQIAAKLYIDSQINNNPYIIIDCPLLNDRNWNFITKHYNSPLFDKQNTIFISNIQSLPDIRRRQLLSLLLDTNAHKRNRILLSCSQTLNEDSNDPSRDFIDYLPCTTIYMPPLRELTDDIRLCATLYLNSLNIELSRQVAGFEPEALSLLCNYDWPDNFMQLKRVLTELVLLTDMPYIQAETVKQTLEKENQQYIPQASSLFDYDRTLNDMIHDIIKVVVSQCGGNQTQAAKKLGIGRTTLWRYLNMEAPS